MTVDDAKEFRCKTLYRGVECCGSKRTECEEGSIPEFALCVWVYLKLQRLQDSRFIIGSHLETKHKSLGVFLFSFVPLPWQHRLHPPEQHLNVSSRPAATNDWFAAAPFSLKKIFGVFTYGTPICQCLFEIAPNGFGYVVVHRMAH